VVTWIDANRRHYGVLLVGRAGVGTTTVAARVGEALVKRGRNVQFIDHCHALSDDQFRQLVGASATTQAGNGNDGVGDQVVWVMTAHQGNPLPPLAAQWWSQGAIRRFDVPPLTVDGTIHLGERLTGAPLARSTAMAIHEFCGGLAVFTREVLSELAQHRDVELVQGRWVRRGPTLSAGPRLVDLAIQLLVDLPEPTRTACEVLGVSGPVPMPIAIDAIGESALDDLLRRGLAAVEGRGQIALFPRALESGVVGGLTAIRQAAIRRLLLASIDGRECPPELLIRIGQWALDQRAEASADVLVRAAEAAVASGQSQTGADLASAALIAEGTDQISTELSVRARLVLGRCQWLLGSMRTAIGTLRPLLVDPSLAKVEVRGYEARAIAGHIVSELLRFGLDAVGSSDEVLDGMERFGDLRSQQLAAVLRPVYAAYSGSLAEALAVFEAQAADPNISTSNRAWSAGAYTMCLLEAGHGDEAVRLGTRSLQIATSERQADPFAVASIVSCLAYVQLLAGGPAQAMQQTAAEVSPLRGTFQYDEGISQLGIGVMYLALGNVRGALDELLGAQAAMHLLDHSGLLRMTTTLMIEPAVLLGRGELAEELSARAAGLPARMSALSTVEQERSLLWLDYLRGGSAAVREAGEPIVQRYLDQGLFGAALRIQHTMLRLAVSPSLERAQVLASSVTGSNLQAMADQLLGVARADFAMLVATGLRLEQQGCLLWAAECLAMAEHVDADTSSSESRSANARKIIELLRATGDVISPWLVGRTSSVPLTPRELEIATQAASGLSNAQVAKRLNIKTRTVETHLQRVYEKLGINRRLDLPAALTDV